MMSFATRYIVVSGIYRMHERFMLTFHSFYPVSAFRHRRNRLQSRAIYEEKPAIRNASNGEEIKFDSSPNNTRVCPTGNYFLLYRGIESRD